MLGVIGNMAPKLSHGETLEDLYEKHYYAFAYVHGSYILICDIESLLTHAVVAMVLQILGSFGTHKIPRG